MSQFRPHCCILQKPLHQPVESIEQGNHSWVQGKNSSLKALLITMIHLHYLYFRIMKVVCFLVKGNSILNFLLGLNPTVRFLRKIVKFSPYFYEKNSNFPQDIKMSKCIETIRSVRMEKILKQAWASCAKLRLRSSLR